MLSDPADDSAAPETLCPLDGGAVEPGPDEFVTSTRCREILSHSETVKRASPETWAAYLVTGDTDTDPLDAPLSRVTTKTFAEAEVGDLFRSHEGTFHRIVEIKYSRFEHAPGQFDETYRLECEGTLRDGTTPVTAAGGPRATLG